MIDAAKPTHADSNRALRARRALRCTAVRIAKPYLKTAASPNTVFAADCAMLRRDDDQMPLPVRGVLRGRRSGERSEGDRDPSRPDAAALDGIERQHQDQKSDGGHRHLLVR